jgi:hypothetical protein
LQLQKRGSPKTENKSVAVLLATQKKKITIAA